MLSKLSAVPIRNSNMYNSSPHNFVFDKDKIKKVAYIFLYMFIVHSCIKKFENLIYVDAAHLRVRHRSQLNRMCIIVKKHRLTTFASSGLVV